MKYYWVTYSDELSEQFGGLALGPLIYIRPKYKGDVGLLEHEKSHVRQWYALLVIGLLLCAILTLLVSSSLWPMCGFAPVLHQSLYKFVRAYRCWCEVRAYRKQIETGGYTNNDFAVNSLANKYDLGLSTEDARKLLVD